MRLLVVILLLVFIGRYANGSEVSNKEAKVVALNWINSVSSFSYEEDNIKEVFTKNKNEKSLYHIVIFDPKGWVFVAGNDLVEPILGYSTESKFEIENQPIQVKEWFEGIGLELEKSYEESYLPATNITDKWNLVNGSKTKKSNLKSATVSSAGPLLTCTWDQGRYYNEMAPADVSATTGNGHVWIGCVATAMSQVMKYWEYPLSGMGSHSYTHDTYGVLSADFENANYNWSAMPDHLTEENTEVQKICYHAAVGVDMDFTWYASGAYLVDALAALTNYFKYNTTIFEANKEDWDNENDWKNQIRSDIDNGRPVIYAGYNSSGSSGHAFVCDGYNNDYFHFNWGWGGTYNGNFLLSSLNPGGSNYSSDQSALFGVEPVTTASISSPYVQGFENSSVIDFDLFGVADISSIDKHNGINSLRLSKSSFTSYSKNTASLTFVVPSEGHLSFWVKRTTATTSTNNQQLALLMPEWGGTPLVEIFNGDFNDTEWTNYNVDISTYAGQIVRLMIIQQNFDTNNEQFMFFDDVAITGQNQNLEPYTPSAPFPVDNSTEVVLNPILKWSGGDPNGQDVAYSVYFGKTGQMNLVSTIYNNQYNPGTLDHSSKYYWQIKSNDGDLESIGPVWSFTTKGIPPEVGFCGFSNITKSSVDACGLIIKDNGASISSRGICWSIYENPSISGNFIVSSGSTNEFNCSILNLNPYTTYYVKAFADSYPGTAYSEMQTFKTKAGLANVSVTFVDEIKRSSAKVIGSLISINDSSIIKRGVVWALNSGFNVENATVVEETGNWKQTGNFVVSLAGLPGPDSIYYKIFVENSAGISYSSERNFVTTNTKPVFDLDANNSSGALISNYFGSVYEQTYGSILDVDASFFDEDGDAIQKVTMILTNQGIDNDEYLVISNTNPSVQIDGNYTDNMMLTNIGNLTNNEWIDVLRTVSVWINTDNPNIVKKREVHFVVNDGYDNSNEAVSILTVRKVNDAPVLQIAPSLSNIPVYGNEVSVVKGTWADVLDACSSEFTYSYQWQVKEGDSIVAIENVIGLNLSIGQDLCGHEIRIVETIVDICGGENAVMVSAESEWYTVEKSPQFIDFVLAPEIGFSAIPYKLTATASSGLMPEYVVLNSEFARVNGDSLFMNKIGRSPISCMQNGNSCFLPSEKVFRILNIEKGTQSILNEIPQNVLFSDKKIPLKAFSSAGLPVQVVSADTNIVQVFNDTLIIKNIGSSEINLSQNGNEFINAAEPVSFSFSVEKGEQQVTTNIKENFKYGEGFIDVFVDNSSGLETQMSSSDNTVVNIVGNQLNIVGVGECFITITQQGDEFYNALSPLQIPIHVSKGNQKIKFEIDGELSFGNNPPYQIASSSGLEIELLSSDLGVLQIGDSLKIVNVGSVNVSAHCLGNEYWLPCDTIFQLEISKGVQEIIVLDSIIKNYGDASFMIDATVSTLLPLDYQIENSGVLNLQNEFFHISSVGKTNVTIVQAGNEFWNEAVKTVMVDVQKGVQVISFDEIGDVVYGETNIELKASSDALLDLIFESSDTSIAIIIGKKVLVKNAGEVIITAKQDGNELWEKADNVTQILKVNKAKQVISTEISQKLTTNDNVVYDDFVVSSGLKISEIVSSDESIISVRNDSLIIKNKGNVELRVSQEGDANYLPITTLFNFEVEYPLSVDVYLDMKFNVFPNPASNEISYTIEGNVRFPVELRVVNAIGKIYKVLSIEDMHGSIDISDLNKGVYFVKINSDSSLRTEKIIVK